MSKLSRNEAAVVNTIVAAYTQVYGQAAWDKLTAQQQHGTVMAIARGAYSALCKIESEK